MNKPYFSIIVASYNAEKYIKATIESVLNQNFDDYEIIVKDACSTDNTLANIPADERICVFLCLLDVAGLYPHQRRTPRLHRGGGFAVECSKAADGVGKAAGGHSVDCKGAGSAGACVGQQEPQGDRRHTARIGEHC